MLAYTLRRILITIPVFIGITMLVFTIGFANPDGGALNSFNKPGRPLSAEQVKALEHRLGYDKSIPEQYVSWFSKILRGNLGNSVLTGRSVGEAIKERLLPTLLLMGSSLLLQELLAIPSGIFSALRKGTIFDQIITIVTYVLFALPTFWFGLMAIVIFGVYLGWFPFGGIIDIRTAGAAFGTPAYWDYFHANTVQAVIDIARHLILPVSVLGAASYAADSRFMRSQMLSVLNQDYVRTAKAKGLTQRSVILKHALRNALLPVVTNIGLQLPVLFSGALVTEQIFGWPGMGRFYINAALTEDYPVVIAYTVIIAVFTLTVNLLTDLSYGLIDPRIRYS